MTADTQQTGTDKRVLALAAFIVVVIGGAIAGTGYFLTANKTVYIEDARVDAPVVELAPTTQGILRALNVNEGDIVPPNTAVAQVGVELIKSASGGLVIATHGDIGMLVNPGETVVEMIDPAQSRIVARIQEDKGLSDIKPGQVVRFTVDAFGGEEFTGIVDEVSPVSRSGDVVFSISDKRQEQDFDVKIKYDTAAHPLFKQGMSAKAWVYKE